MAKLRLNIIDAFLVRNLEWMVRLAEEALKAEKFEEYYEALTAISELVERHQLIADFRNAISILARRARAMANQMVWVKLLCLQGQVLGRRAGIRPVGLIMGVST